MTGAMTGVAAVMTRTETHYTPQRVEQLLRRLPYLYDRQSPREDEPRRSGKRHSPAGWIEERMAEHADIEWALQQLPQPTYRIVYLSYVGGKSLREVGAIVGCSHTTVRHHKLEGVRWMAWWLGWRDPASGWGERKAG